MKEQLIHNKKVTLIESKVKEEFQIEFMREWKIIKLQEVLYKHKNSIQTKMTLAMKLRLLMNISSNNIMITLPKILINNITKKNNCLYL